jgi:arylsulfatase A-like enzyme
MAELDWVVGELLKKLDDLGIADNTVVVFTTDNGRYGGADSRTTHTCDLVHWLVHPFTSPWVPSVHWTRTVTGIGSPSWRIYKPSSSPRHLSGACSTGCRSTTDSVEQMFA